jgi:hypothetical protein|tara:strand:+ start:364 stop:768 length:405 start_codon:yes stop_codon:yes gene_type:complete
MEITKVSDDVSILYDNGNIIKCDEIPITHNFADQIYLRQMNMSKDQFVMGAFHNHKHIWFLMTGRVSIKSNDEVVEHIAPCYTVSIPGIQRFIYAHEDSIFINIHKNPDNTTDIEELEKRIVSLNKEEYEQQKK